MEPSYNQIPSGTRVPKMENAALVLAILALFSGFFPYLSVVSGAMAIILAHLSKGGTMHMSGKVKIAVTIAVVGIIVSCCLYMIAIAAALHTYGSWEGILRNYCDTYGMDYNSLFSAN